VIDITLVIEWMQHHADWAYVSIFVIALVESLAIIGLFIPGVALMIGAGGLIASGILNFSITCASVFAGAVIGDTLSYWFGCYYQDRVRYYWPFIKHPHLLERGIQFFSRYGIASIALARFFGPMRAIVPLIAGMLHMPVMSFVTTNICSAVVWAPSYLLPGLGLSRLIHWFTT
jgi:undecaprenyl-diphosphatase